MKRFIKIVMVVLLTISMVACSDNSDSEENDKVQIVVTIYPIYDWVSNIVGDNCEVTLLLNNGVDMHSYQASVDDIVNISSADVVIYVGGPSDDWVNDALNNATNEDMQVINLLEVLGDKAKLEELKEGMEETEEEEEEYDEHVWLSIKNAEVFVEEIANVLASKDSSNSEEYLNNANDYLAKLEELDMEYQEVINSSSIDTLIFADRFPFLYLLSDYGLDYYAAFVGCSSEVEASFETIKFLSEKVDELAANHIYVLETSDQKLAQTIIDNSNSKDCEILVLDSIQATSSDTATSYLEIMESNLEVLKIGLEVE